LRGTRVGRRGVVGFGRERRKRVGGVRKQPSSGSAGFLKAAADDLKVLSASDDTRLTLLGAAAFWRGGGLGFVVSGLEFMGVEVRGKEALSFIFDLIYESNSIDIMNVRI